MKMSRLWWPLCGGYRAFWSVVWRGLREKGRFGFWEVWSAEEARG